MALRSGEIWIFRFTGKAELALEPSAYLEKGRVHPRPCTQIVLHAQAQRRGDTVRLDLGEGQRILRWPSGTLKVTLRRPIPRPRPGA